MPSQAPKPPQGKTPSGRLPPQRPTQKPARDRGKPVPAEAATARRRALAASVDALACLLLAALPYLLGLVSPDVFIPDDGFFWPDHMVLVLGRYPANIIGPVVWLLLVWCCWQFGWMYFDRGHSPGTRLARIKAVNVHGDPLTLTHAIRRALGHLLSGATLGLGWLWIFISPSRRSWPDLLSSTHMIRTVPLP